MKLTESRMARRIKRARQHPHEYRLPDETRDWFAALVRTFKHEGRFGSIVRAHLRALALDQVAREEEARRAQLRATGLVADQEARHA